MKKIKLVLLTELSVLVFILIFWVFSTNIILAQVQKESEAVLIDEFGAVKCDEIRSRVDNLLKELSNVPNSEAYIVIRGEKKRPITKYMQKLLLEAYIDIRQFDKNRIIFLRGKDEEGVRIQFWKVPNGVNMPSFEVENWDYKLPQIIKPFVVHKNSWVSEVCPDIFSIKFYSSLLLSNPDSRGHLVIYEKSAKNFYQTKIELIEELIRKYKISRNQLKFFYVKSKKTDVEFWYVPSNVSIRR